jgi:amino acid permease
MPDAAAASTTVGWKTMAFILMSDQIGFGVLSVPKAYTRLGYVGGTCAVLFLGALTTFTGLLLAKIRNRHPDIDCYQRLFSRTFNPSVGRYAAFCVKYVPLNLHISRCQPDQL